MKPWSITTTVRNPERIRGFLAVLQNLEGEVWDIPNQCRYQVMLIQHKLYGSGNTQFYKGLTTEQIALMETPDVIDYEAAAEILEAKNYVGGGDMRGRQSFNPLEKMGLAYLDTDNRVRISEFGNYFLQPDYDLGEVFFRSFLKWQIPNPDVDDYRWEDGYDIKPFIGTLHLINEVNRICEEKGLKTKGISKLEFEYFALTLCNYQIIKQQANRLVAFRNEYEELKTTTEKEAFLSSYKAENLSDFHNLGDYADNAIRYFRLTRYIYLRGNGYYVDLEPRRAVEIQALLNADNGAAVHFSSREEYQRYICDMQQPALPWDNETALLNIAENTSKEVSEYQTALLSKDIVVMDFEFKEIERLDAESLKQYVQALREYRKELQQAELHFNSQQINEIENYVDDLKNIFRHSNKPVELERLCTMALNALNDAIAIRPNYPVGDDNEPTFTAPANKPDIECYYQSFNAICEVTMLTTRQQWYAEGQPVMRHLRDFESQSAKESYCLFIAPNLHRDTINTYWTSVKYEYEGQKQRIVPLTVKQLLMLLDALIIKKKKGNCITHNELKALFDSIIELTNKVPNSEKWIETIPETIKQWKEQIAA